MAKQSKHPNRTNPNPYARGFSPAKVIKLDEETGGPKEYEPVNYSELFQLYHGKNVNDDGYRPYILSLARGKGSFVDRNSVVHWNLNQMVMPYFRHFIVRGQNGEDFRNETASNGIYWSRRLLFPTDDGGEELISLDHYLTDDDVVRVMEAHNQY